MFNIPHCFCCRNHNRTINLFFVINFWTTLLLYYNYCLIDSRLSTYSWIMLLPLSIFGNCLRLIYDLSYRVWPNYWLSLVISNKKDKKSFQPFFQINWYTWKLKYIYSTITLIAEVSIKNNPNIEKKKKELTN